eukprot:CAMPEP_0179239084 /NCGR_PEP_ID=MMETSP0797-20121207/15280_1 /TAXON_ID=47934 /ORGANISM="Dinophysis acuminata, Strain DAEP01" /LENGTH=67 /DNA_ID=CAMNT_0020946399 /DNA_START=232 /DNA_END=435 /DNA_ORIENTATION=+
MPVLPRRGRALLGTSTLGAPGHVAPVVAEVRRRVAAHVLLAVVRPGLLAGAGVLALLPVLSHGHRAL